MSSDASPPRERDDRERSRLERIVPELVKKLVDVGVEKLSDGPENLRQLLAEMKLPRDAILLLASQLDETKKEVARVLARELREFLERASLADEVTRLLSGLTLEVKTQIHFIPNASATGRPRPEVKTKLGVRKASPEETEPTEQDPLESPEVEGTPERRAEHKPDESGVSMSEQETRK